MIRLPAAPIINSVTIAGNEAAKSDDGLNAAALPATTRGTSAALAADALGLGWIALGFAHLLLLRFSGFYGSGHCLFLLLVVWQVRWQHVEIKQTQRYRRVKHEDALVMRACERDKDSNTLPLFVLLYFLHLRV